MSFKQIKTIDFNDLNKEYRYQVFEEYDRIDLWVPTQLYFRYPLMYSFRDSWYTQKEIDKWIIETANLTQDDEYVLIRMDH